jgi:hypothetical protein
MPQLLCQLCLWSNCLTLVRHQHQPGEHALGYVLVNAVKPMRIDHGYSLL